jgi:hypothetical protein
MDNYRSNKYPGLVAVAHPDQFATSPLEEVTMRGIKIIRLNTRQRYEGDEPGHLEIECPQCDGFGGTVWDSTGGMAQSCPDCDESGYRNARTGQEWTKANKTGPALPFRMNYDTSQPWIQSCEWDEEPDGILVLTDPDEFSDYNKGLKCLEGEIREETRYLQEGAYYLEVRPDPESDNPAPDLPYMGCGGYIGFGYLEEAAKELLSEAYAQAEAERQERAEMAARDIVTTN